MDTGTTIGSVFERFKLQRRVSELEDRLSAAERQLKGLTLDSDDLFDRMKRLHGRVAKRDEREQTNLQEMPTEGAAESSQTLALSPTWSKLTARQRQVQMQILHRRANGGTM